jgi:hypothetical protein
MTGGIDEHASSYAPPRLTFLGSNHQGYQRTGATVVVQTSKDSSKMHLVELNQPLQGDREMSDVVGASSSVAVVNPIIVATPPKLQLVHLEVVDALTPVVVGNVEEPIIHNVGPEFQKFVYKLARFGSDKSLLIQK